MDLLFFKNLNPIGKSKEANKHNDASQKEARARTIQPLLN